MIFSKVFLDTTVAGPCFLTIYFCGTALAEGKSFSESWNVLKSAFIPVYTADICYWPLMQAINFYIIPSRYRVLAISICQVAWNSFLSFMNNIQLVEKKSQLVVDSKKKIEVVGHHDSDEHSVTGALASIKQRVTVSASSEFVEPIELK